VKHKVSVSVYVEGNPLIFGIELVASKDEARKLILGNVLINEVERKILAIITAEYALCDLTVVGEIYDIITVTVNVCVEIEVLGLKEIDKKLCASHNKCLHIFY
jgi:hypothetical protein